MKPESRPPSVQRTTDDFALTPIERLYQQHLNGLSGMEKMLQMQALCASMIDSLVHQVHQEFGPLPDRERNYRIAQRLYRNDPKFLKLLDMYYAIGEQRERA